jgi:hypothetical protein
MFARWGGAIAPLLLAILLQYVNWRRAFRDVRRARRGLVHLLVPMVRDRPADHPQVSAAELALIPTVEGSRDRKCLGSHGVSPSLWLLWLQCFTLSYA